MKSSLVHFIVLLSVIARSEQSKISALQWKVQQLDENPEASMTSVEIIRHRGYAAQVHTVTTEDGYILELHRILPIDGVAVGRPIFLHHGLMGASSDWILNPTHKSLGFMLSNLGYDVWLANARGNTYSRNHTKYRQSDAKFWDYSIDEIGTYDIPACIDYIIRESASEKLIYIGHSMGCTVFYMAMMKHANLNDKIELMISLAPATSMANLKSPAKVFAPHVLTIQFMLRLIQTRAFLSNDNWMRRMQQSICERVFQTRSVCRNALFSITAATNKYHFNASVAELIEAHNPAGISVNTLAQFAQNYNAGQRYGETFRHYDYGSRGNFQRYGQSSPPAYNFSLVTCPVSIFWADNDQSATPKDVEWLSKQLGNLKSSMRVDWPEFNHLDFLWYKDVDSLLYSRLVELLPPPSPESK